MSRGLSRRAFLKLGGLALGALAFRSAPYGPDYPRWPETDLGMLVRIAAKQVDVRSRPTDDAPIVGNRFHDQVLHVYEELRPPDAPKYYNTLWYRVWGGFIHSARTQQVQVRLNQTAPWVSSGGVLAEVTVPFTTAYSFQKWDQQWVPWRGSRLYYSSMHWITGMQPGPDGRPWYQITNELSDSEIYYAPPEHFRLIPAEEYSPLSLDVPAEKKRIEITLREQTLRAYEYDQEVFTTRISSGVPNHHLMNPTDFPTATPKGRFVIYSKMPSKHMGSVAGGEELDANGGFTLPGVPWTSFFKSPGGYALHGTYWHNNFGLQMSHGCVNLRNEDALWLFRCTTPVFDPYKIASSRDWERTGNGTTVVVT